MRVVPAPDDSPNTDYRYALPTQSPRNAIATLPNGFDAAAWRFQSQNRCRCTLGNQRLAESDLQSRSHSGCKATPDPASEIWLVRADAVVEAGGVEPPSKADASRASTSVACLLISRSANPQAGMPLSPVRFLLASPCYGPKPETLVGFVHASFAPTDPALGDGCS